MFNQRVGYRFDNRRAFLVGIGRKNVPFMLGGREIVNRQTASERSNNWRRSMPNPSENSLPSGANTSSRKLTAR